MADCWGMYGTDDNIDPETGLPRAALGLIDSETGLPYAVVLAPKDEGEEEEIDSVTGLPKEKSAQPEFDEFGNPLVETTLSGTPLAPREVRYGSHYYDETEGKMKRRILGEEEIKAIDAKAEEAQMKAEKKEKKKKEKEEKKERKRKKKEEKKKKKKDSDDDESSGGSKEEGSDGEKKKKKKKDKKKDKKNAEPVIEETPSEQYERELKEWEKEEEELWRLRIRNILFAGLFIQFTFMCFSMFRDCPDHPFHDEFNSDNRRKATFESEYKVLKLSLTAKGLGFKAESAIINTLKRHVVRRQSTSGKYSVMIYPVGRAKPDYANQTIQESRFAALLESRKHFDRDFSSSSKSNTAKLDEIQEIQDFLQNKIYPVESHCPRFHANTKTLYFIPTAAEIRATWAMDAFKKGKHKKRLTEYERADIGCYTSGGGQLASIGLKNLDDRKAIVSMLINMGDVSAGQELFVGLMDRGWGILNVTNAALNEGNPEVTGLWVWRDGTVSIFKETANWAEGQPDVAGVEKPFCATMKMNADDPTISVTACGAATKTPESGAVSTMPLCEKLFKFPAEWHECIPPEPEPATTTTAAPTTPASGMNGTMVGANGTMMGVNGTMMGVNGTMMGVNGTMMGANGTVMGADEMMEGEDGMMEGDDEMMEGDDGMMEGDDETMEGDGRSLLQLVF